MLLQRGFGQSCRVELCRPSEPADERLKLRTELKNLFVIWIDELRFAPRPLLRKREGRLMMQKVLRALLCLQLCLIPLDLLAQTDNTVYVKNYSGSTVGQMAAAAQAACNPSLACIVIFDPSLANYTQGTLPTPCSSCIWEDYRVPGALSFTGNLYVNGTLLSAFSGGAAGNGTGVGNGTLAAPTFSPAGGSYSSSLSVTLNVPAGATGCYTVDGSTPSAASPGTCSNGLTYSSPITVTTSETISALATEPGWTNSSVATAVYSFGSTSSYSDNFSRANGSLGVNWTQPPGAQGTLQIMNNLIYAATPGPSIIHSEEIYTAGTFANNQYSTITLESGTGGSASGSASQFAVVRGMTGTPQFYNDGVATGSTHGGLAFRVGDQNSVDFCGSPWWGSPYAIGDTHQLAVAGTGPVFFWSLHNGVIDSSCVDTTDNYISGQPGLGVVDPNTTPTLAEGPWQGGSLPDFSTTPSDNFQRANAGWLGDNWWFAMSPGSGFILQSNSAVLSVPGNYGVSVWTTPFNTNHSSIATVGSLASGDWVGAVARYQIPANNPNSSLADHYYLALIVGGGNTVDLFAWNAGTWQLLSTLGTYSGTASTIELDATGTSPVSLTVKINGMQFGATYNDTTYNFNGGYAGFAVYGTRSSSVTGWTGANL